MLSFNKTKALDFICVGRANVDLYAVERDTTLQATSGFVKSVGGTPANIAVALSRLGAKAGFIGKVSKDPLGDFVYNYLESKGIDVTHLTYDHSGSRTSLVLAEVKQDECEVLFYRNNAADLLISTDDIEEEFIRNAKAVILTGTAFSASPSREAMFSIINYARQNGTLVILDLDYRPSEWTNPEEASIYYNMAADKVDILIGNTEEFDILDYLNLVKKEENTIQQLLDNRAQLVICKMGKKGAKVYTKWGEVVERDVFPVEKLKPYGSGDAFAAAFLNALLTEGQSIDESLKLASAAGAILVSKSGCAEAMPSKEEILKFIDVQENPNLIHATSFLQ